MELPRPLEPRASSRPSLQSSLSDSTAIYRRPDAFRSPTQITTRSQYTSLPGLKDILPDAQTNHGTWTKSNHHSTGYVYQGEVPFSLQTLHPPMTLYPPHSQDIGYPTPSSRPFEVPIVEKSRRATHQPQYLPPSPYTGYPESARDYDPHLPPGNFPSNGVHSPYGPPGPEEKHMANAPSGFEGPGTSPHTTSGADPQSGKKFLYTRDIPGEGRFHIYEGGHRIPAVVDGEQVNPVWGLTKANKPRKRLALACLDCREKKIKCEPGVNSCLQCEKARRPCRRWSRTRASSRTMLTFWQSYWPDLANEHQH
jgi:hypothetical protein